MSDLPDPEALARGLGLVYRDATEAEIAELRAELDRILSDESVPRASAEALERWERGWGEVLARAKRDGVTQASLAPQYFRHTMMRLAGRYIRAGSTDFEPRLYRAIKNHLFRRYLADAEHVVEIGCGTGLNLLQLRELLPDARLTGADWARPSQELVAMIPRVRGVRFDMRTLEGRDDLGIGPETVVLTLHAMEQLGSDWGPLFDFLTAATPRMVLHIEPIAELYDPMAPFDAAALAYHRKRGYLDGYLTALRARENIKIEVIQRLNFGSPYHEAYSLIVWRPISHTAAMQK